MKRTILYPDRIVDGTGAPPLDGHAVILSDGLIEAICPVAEVNAQDDDTKIDLAGTTLTPGLINNHVHLVLPGDNTPFEAVQLESDNVLTLRAAHNASVSLHAGVTTVRDCGCRGTTVVDLRNMQTRGLAHCARVITCGWPLTITGGHGRYFGGEADGEDALSSMIRRLVSLGVDFIKVLASGGGTAGSLSHFPSFSPAELRGIVSTAHGLGQRVSAHCTATQSIEIAVDAGVDWIEHALFIARDGQLQYDARVAEKMAISRIPVTTTMQVAKDMLEVALPPAERGKWEQMLERDREFKRTLRELGVSLLAGSDSGWRCTRFDTFWRELEELVVIGMSPVEAIHAATGATAEALDRADQIGAIRPGLIADLTAVNGDATADIGRLADIRAVFQAGVQVLRS